MKKLILGLLISGSISSFSQTTSIPDPVFEQLLINQNIDTDGIVNGQVLTADISGITSLDVSNSAVSDLTGLQDFISLQTLNAFGTNITTLNVSNNAALEYLHAYNTLLTGSVDVSSNSLLLMLNLSNTDISSVDVRFNLLLQHLFVNNTRISNLNVTNNTDLQELRVYNTSLTSLDVRANTALRTLDIDNTAITSIDVSKNTSLTRLIMVDTSITSIDVSNNSLLAILWVNGSKISNLNVANNTLLTNLGAGNLSIGSIDVRNNTELIYLDVSRTSISSLNVTNNTKLEELIVWGSPIGDLDVSTNTSLTKLDIENTGISSLDISTNTQLSFLDASRNNFTSLDLSNNPLITELNLRLAKIDQVALDNMTALTSLNISDSKLSSLDLSNNLLLTSFNAINVPSLSCIQVADATAATAGSGNYASWQKDTQTFYSEGTCNYTPIPDANFESVLVSRDIDTDGVVNGRAKTIDLAGVTSLLIPSENIANLSGIEAFAALESLSVFDNPITTINLSNNLNLKSLNVGNPSIVQGQVLTSLEVSKNTLLEILQADHNALAALDLTNNPWLTSLDVSHNALIALNITNNPELLELNMSFNAIINFDNNQNSKLTKLLLNNNSIERAFLRNGANTTITEFDIRDNPNLKCITVDDIQFAITNFTQKDATANYNTDCNSQWTVYTVDNDFEAALNNTAGLDVNGDGEVTYEEAQAYTGDLDFSGKNIADVTGLEAFTSADIVNLSNNKIRDINSFLTSKSFLIQSRTSGEVKRVNRKPKIKIRTLNISNNSISTMDISSTEGLEELYASGNELESLSLKTGLNKSASAKSLNPGLKILDVTNNPKLSCIEVDNVEEALAKGGWQKDDTATYNVSCKVLSSDDNFLKENVSVYPNPTSGNFRISLSNRLTLKNVTLFNLFGKKLLKVNAENIDISTFSKGVYFAKINTNLGVVNIKIVKSN